MNNDRLNFRAWNKVTLTDDEDNDYEKSFMLYNVDPFKGYVVGIREEDFEKQLTEQGFSEDEIEQIECDYSSNPCEDYFNIDVDEIDQCTGLRDKKGKLIYEGDVVSCMMNCPRKGVVEFYRNAFCLNENGSYSEDIVFSDKCCEVIGNIHENPELLK